MTKTPTNDAIVQGTMGSLDNAGCILVLVGPSSVGKSRIVEGMQKLDNEKPEENKRNWEIDGVDAASQRMFGKLNNEYKNAIGEDADFLSLRSKFPEGHIFHIVHEGGIKEERFKKYDCPELSQLVEKYTDQFKDIRNNTLGKPQDWALNFIEETYGNAVENARNGKSVILDLVPTLDSERKGYNVVTALKEYADQNGFAGEIIAVNANCDIGKITKHVDERNAGKDPTQYRRDFRPFLQHAQMNQIVGDESENQTGECTIREVLEAASKYGTNRDEDATAILKELGVKLPSPISDLDDAALDNPIKLSPKSSHLYDILCITDSGRESAEEDIKRNSKAIDDLVSSRVGHEKIVPAQNAQGSAAISESMVQKASGSESSLMENPNIKEQLDDMVESIVEQQQSSNSQMENSELKEDDKGEEFRGGEVVGKWTEKVTAGSKSSKGPEL
jgi:hypothetical protein